MNTGWLALTDRKGWAYMYMCCVYMSNCVLVCVCVCECVCVCVCVCVCALQIFSFDKCDQRLVIGTVIFIGDGSCVIHCRPRFLPKSEKDQQKSISIYEWNMY